MSDFDHDDHRRLDARHPAASTDPITSPAPAPPSMLGAVGAMIGPHLLQRKLLQRRIAERSIERAPDDEARSVQAAAAEGISGSGGALPHADAIQRSFGRHDVSGISAHTDAKAAGGARAMGAEAFATGQHVAFAHASPSLHTAAHEAAHVVQQRGGVKLKGGVGEAGDAHEQHADAVADLVVQGRSAEPLLDRYAGPDDRATQSGGPVQRDAVPYHDQSSQDQTYLRNKDAVGAVAGKIDNAVKQARAMALDWRNLLNHGDAHVKRWAVTAKAYFDKPAVTPDFIHARFGYAIETLACATLGNTESGLTVGKQVAYGATRPDLVLYEGNAQIAWLDITSSDSAKHIFGKDHSGWKTKPFVYEILYTPLNLEEVLTGTPDPVYAAVGGFMAKKNQIRYEEETKAKNLLHDKLTKLRDTGDWSTGTGNATTKRQTTQALLQQDNDLKMDLGLHSMKATRGALAVAEVYDGPFGFNSGNVGTESQAANAWVGQKAAKPTQDRTAQLEKSELERICGALANWKSIPLVAKLFELAKTPSSEVVHIAISVHTGIQVLDKLRGASLRLVKHRQTDKRAATMLYQVTLQEMAFPDSPEFAPMQKWTLQALDLADKCDKLRAIIEAPPVVPQQQSLGNNVLNQGSNQSSNQSSNQVSGGGMQVD